MVSYVFYHILSFCVMSLFSWLRCVCFINCGALRIGVGACVRGVDFGHTASDTSSSVNFDNVLAQLEKC
jgi:hypothetical protein